MMKKSGISTSKRTFDRKLQSRLEVIRKADNVIVNRLSDHPKSDYNSKVGEILDL